MKNIGTGTVIVYTPAKELRFEGEIEMTDGRVIVSEIVYINGKPGGVKEINLPLEQCHVYWKPVIYDQDSFQQEEK